MRPRRGASLVQYILVLAILLGSIVLGFKAFSSAVAETTNCQGGVIAGASKRCSGESVPRPGASVGTVAALPAAASGGVACDALGCRGGSGTSERPIDEQSLVEGDPSAINPHPPSVSASPPRTNYNVVRYGTINGPAFVVGRNHGSAVHPADVSQGQIGDCWIMASLASLAARQPSFLQSGVRQIGNGQFQVRLFVNGRFTWVGTNNRFPVAVRAYDEGTKTWSWQQNARGVFAAPGQTARTGPELWPMLYEQAFARASGGYDAIGHGGAPSSALTTLTGQRSTDWDTSRMSFRTFAAFVNAGYAVIGSSNSAPAAGTVDNPLFVNDTLAHEHAYWVESVDTRRGTVTLRNPWGWGEGTITLTWAQFQATFGNVATNPITDRRRR